MNTIFPDFHLPTKVFISPDILDDAGEIITPFGKRAIIVTTSADLEKMESSVAELQAKVASSGTACIVYDEIPETPNTEFIDSAVYFAKRTNCDLIIGFGGIESINAAKAVEEARYTQIVREASDVRAERVREIKAQIDAGTYDKDMDDKVISMVADKILSNMLRR